MKKKRKKEIKIPSRNRDDEERKFLCKMQQCIRRTHKRFVYYICICIHSTNKINKSQKEKKKFCRMNQTSVVARTRVYKRICIRRNRNELSMKCVCAQSLFLFNQNYECRF